MRTVKGPGHLPLAMNILDKARTEGTKAIVAYNVIIKVTKVYVEACYDGGM